LPRTLTDFNINFITNLTVILTITNLSIITIYQMYIRTSACVQMHVWARARACVCVSSLHFNSTSTKCS